MSEQQSLNDGIVATMDHTLANLHFGPYVTPVCVSGAIVECEVRGLVRVVGISRGRIPWPIGERDGIAELIVFKALAKAVRQEAPEAIAAWWGVDVGAARAWKAACKQPRQRKKQTLASPAQVWSPDDDALLRHSTLEDARDLPGDRLPQCEKGGGCSACPMLD